MSEMSDMFKLVNAMELAKTARVGMSLTYFDVIELLGELNSLYEYIDELEAFKKIVNDCGFDVVTDAAILEYPARKVLRGVDGSTYVPDEERER